MSAQFYKLGVGEEVPHWIYHRSKGDREWQQIDVDGPQPLASKFPLLTIKCEHKQRMPDLFESGSKAIVSSRFREVAKSFSVAAEFLPIKVLGPNGGPNGRDPYWFMHVVERLDCINFQDSVYEAWSDKPESEFRRLSKLTFREDVIGDRALFKPKRYSQLFVSQQLHDSLIEAKCLVTFTPLDRVRL